MCYLLCSACRIFRFLLVVKLLQWKYRVPRNLSIGYTASGGAPPDAVQPIVTNQIYWVRVTVTVTVPVPFPKHSYWASDSS